MTVQAKNQDLLNPADPTGYATQLATFTQVKQQIKANTLLENGQQCHFCAWRA